MKVAGVGRLLMYVYINIYTDTAFHPFEFDGVFIYYVLSEPI